MNFYLYDEYLKCQLIGKGSQTFYKELFLKPYYIRLLDMLFRLIIRNVVCEPPSAMLQAIRCFAWKMLIF